MKDIEIVTLETLKLVSQPETKTYELHVRWKFKETTDEAKAQIVAMSPPVRLQHTVWKEAEDDAKRLSERGGVQSVAVVTLRTRREYKLDSVYDDGFRMQANGRVFFDDRKIK